MKLVLYFSHYLVSSFIFTADEIMEIKMDFKARNSSKENLHTYNLLIRALARFDDAASRWSTFYPLRLCCMQAVRARIDYNSPDEVVLRHHHNTVQERIELVHINATRTILGAPLWCSAASGKGRSDWCPAAWTNCFSVEGRTWR